MELFIRIVDGQPFEHPIFGENFRQAFPHIDTDNLPPEFARFERIEPTPSEFEVPDHVRYQLENGVVKDAWVYRPMTDEEKTAAIQLKLYLEKHKLAGSVPHVIG